MNSGVKKFLLKICVIAFFICSVIFLLTLTRTKDIKANEQPVFKIENGAWIKAVDSKNLADSNAIRFQFYMNDEFVEQNAVKNLNATATITLNGGDEANLLDVSFDNPAELVLDGEYTHYFDFANFPVDCYDNPVFLEITANFSNGESQTKSIERTMEYVASQGIIKDGKQELFNYLEGDGDTVFSVLDALSFNQGEMAKIVIDDYNGAQISSVYVNAKLQSDCSLISPVNNENAVSIDTSLLTTGIENCITAITLNGDLIFIKSLKINKSVENVTLNEIYAKRDSGKVVFDLPDEYPVKEAVLSNGDKISAKVNGKTVSFEVDNLILPSGKNYISLTLDNSA